MQAAAAPTITCRPFLTVSFIISYKDVKIPFKGSPGERGNTGNTGAAGENAPQVQCQFSSNGISWHAEFASGDAYIRFSTDDASTWGATILFKGEKGDTGDSGPTGATGAQGSIGVSIRSKGAWSNATEYVNNAVYIDIVNHNGSSYICKLTGTNFEPPNATYWNLAASKGEIGATGATGNTGATGVAAPNVLTEYSSNNASWHSTYAAGDEYIRFSYDGGSTYGTGMLFKGLDGEGTGDVIAPATNTDGSFPQWDGSNTKTLKDGFTLSQLMLTMYPVGAIFTSVVSTSPATLFGGTWSAFGAGRVLVSYQSGDSDFGTVEGTTGSKTHTLAQTEIPAHTHTQNSHTHSINHDHASATSDSNGAHSHKLVWDSTGTPKYVSLSGSDAGGTYQSSGYRTGYSSGSVYDESTIAESVSAHTHAVDLPSYSGTSGSTTATSQNTGSGNAHNNLQPSITVYMWKRTA